MLIDKILDYAKKQKVYVFFDMDGVLVEYPLDREKRRYQPGTDFYTNNRPIKYTLGVAEKLSKENNVVVGIISNCPLAEQIEQKKSWLKKYAPFIKDENINIICYEKISFKEEKKHILKGKLLKEKIMRGDCCFLIEDDLQNIVSVNNFFDDEIVFHVSNIIEWFLKIWWKFYIKKTPQGVFYFSFIFFILYSKYAAR